MGILSEALTTDRMQSEWWREEAAENAAAAAAARRRAITEGHPALVERIREALDERTAIRVWSSNAVDYILRVQRDGVTAPDPYGKIHLDLAAMIAAEIPVTVSAPVAVAPKPAAPVAANLSPRAARKAARIAAARAAGK